MSALAQESEFSISGECNKSIIGGVAFDGTNYLIGLAGDLVSNSSVTVQFVSPDGKLSGTRISLGETGSAPVVAFDGTNYLVIWADRYVSFLDNGKDAGMTSVYGRFITPSGTFAGDKFIIAKDAYIKGCVPGAVHFNGTNYFFIYKEDDGNSDVGPEFGRLISKDGKMLGNPVQITESAVEDIAIGFDGTNYLTAFNLDSRYIYGQFVSAGGSLVGSRFLIDGSDNYSDDPISVAFGGGKYMVAFHDDSKPGLNENPDWNLLAHFVSTSGSVDPQLITICSSGQHPLIPTVAFDGKNYLTSWISLSDQQIKGRLLNGDGKPVDQEYVIFDKVGETMPLGGISPFSGNKCLATCTRVVWPVSNNGGEPRIGEKSAFISTNNGIFGKFLSDPTSNISRKAAEDELFSVYPNPAKNQVSLRISGRESATLNVYSIAGELLISAKVSKSAQQIYVGNLLPGVYLLELKGSNWTGVKKLTVEK